ncbi:TonB-dependent hemoglobin/transferrin/lactoferrin family receptor [Uliginosibacterium sp. TH139]|uniref:TonB-dependent hemoglobin/transferrin/lactoferrin family receptor n=1 Tax=Uliginosibacterium sp. TH139 TaxID=2067453 RepID=UPI000C7D1BE5|nr:TonB-dependent hemoglobin/transferrin/lactoferrin family receptor [Uliginosibacterium sp. TH139]PLK49237.1 TonB-dependent hemoglobin/transferrin/lactoferrin family receptor [Uliginosibacterium sp. TH139]
MAKQHKNIGRIAAAAAQEQFRLQRMALAVMCAWPLAGMAQQTSEPQLGTVVVTATRSEAHANDVAGTVTAVTQKQIEQHQARNLAEVLADEPDVSVPSDPRRFGGSHVNIRGIEENRILMLTDGVRAADFRSPGTTNYDANNRDIPFVEFFKQVEVLRGPASSLYGSDAIGGVLGFLTLDPSDLLKGREFAAGGSLGYHSVDKSKRATASFAAGGERFQGLFMVGHARGEETDNQGSSRVQGVQRTAPNPLTYEQSNVLGKLLFTPNREHRFKLTLEHKEGETAVDAQRVGNGTSLSRITTNTGVDSLERNRVVLDYDYMPEASWFDRLSAKLYTQTQTTDNQNYQLRTNTSSSCSATTAGTTNCSVNQRFAYEQSQTGLNLLQEKAFTLAGLPNQAIWGADLLRLQTEESKTGVWTNLATGATSTVLVGDSYPKAEYPRGHTDQLGLFAQDEITLGKFKLTPGLRYDSFKLEPESDPLYKRTDGREAVSKEGSHLSPKLAGVYSLSQDWNLYAQYLEGFRGPNYEETNRYFYNSSQRYAVIGNPDLKPETSRSFEVGSKYAGSAWGSQFALYENHYSNFIEYTLLPSGSAEGVAGYSTYKYQNLSKVVIRGGDWRGYWQALPALRLSAGLAITHGYDKSSGKPLNSIEPKRGTFAAMWTPSEQWGAEWRLRAATGKDHIDTSSTNYYRTPGYGVNDLSAWWQVQPHVKLNLAINNLFDKTYYLWSDVRRSGLTATDPAPEFYTQPGRNFALSVKFDY